MINFIDIIFVLLTIIFIVVSITRGLLVCVISLVRFFVIVPASFYIGNYLEPYFTKYIFKGVSAGLTNILSIILSFFILLILSSLLIHLLKKLQNKKGVPLRHTNALLGGVFGLAKSLLIIIAVSTLVYYVMPYVSPDSNAEELLGTSIIINYVNKFNPFVI